MTEPTLVTRNETTHDTSLNLIKSDDKTMIKSDKKDKIIYHLRLILQNKKSRTVRHARGSATDRQTDNYIYELVIYRSLYFY